MLKVGTNRTGNLCLSREGLDVEEKQICCTAGMLSRRHVHHETPWRVSTPPSPLHLYCPTIPSSLPRLSSFFSPLQRSFILLVLSPLLRLFPLFAPLLSSRVLVSSFNILFNLVFSYFCPLPSPSVLSGWDFSTSSAHRGSGLLMQPSFERCFPASLSAVTPPSPPLLSPPRRDSQQGPAAALPRLKMVLRAIVPAFFFMSAVCVQSVCVAASRTGPKVTEKVGDDAAFICMNPKLRLLASSSRSHGELLRQTRWTRTDRNTETFTCFSFAAYLQIC